VLQQRQVAAYLEAESTAGERSPSESEEESFDAETLEAVAVALSARCDYISEAALATAFV
jgi:hypothetical protein